MLQHFVKDGLVLGFGAVAENNPVGLGELGGLVHPGFHRSCHDLRLHRNRCNASKKQLQHARSDQSQEQDREARRGYG